MAIKKRELPKSAVEAPATRVESGKDILLNHAANELVFAVVGHVGSGTSVIAEQLEHLLKDKKLTADKPFEVARLSARKHIEQWAKVTGKPIPPKKQEVATATAYQDLGDAMRLETKDNAAVARAMVGSIVAERARFQGKEVGDEPIKPDGKRRAYILESIRHPEEVQLLRHLYQDAFILVGVVTLEEPRSQRLTNKYSDCGKDSAIKFMRRDAKDGPKHGQRVSDAFHLADFFVDNTADRNSRDWDVAEVLSRLIKIVLRDTIVRPKIAETAMHDAFSASLRSACLSRQVGAAIINSKGELIATGTNEVPMAGGGVYGKPSAEPDAPESKDDHRCAFTNKFCSNTREQITIVKGLIDEIPELSAVEGDRKFTLPQDLRSSRIGDLIEFSRAVHAEMDALLSVGRTGGTTLGTSVYVTTYPCHYCARHLVSAGVDRVEYIEPYPKSQATALHSDSITENAINWSPPSEGGGKVLFTPFVGVAPRMYRRAFLKDGELKNSVTGDMQPISADWGTPWHLRSAAYHELELKISRAKT